MAISAINTIYIVLIVIMIGMIGITVGIFLRIIKEIISDIISFRADGPMASDGHRIHEDQDISCRRYGHWHEEFDTPRFIPHEDPEEGYIVINGVNMKRDESDKYQNRI